MIITVNIVGERREVHLFYNKDKVAQFNAQKLNSLGTPIARINNKRNLN